MKARMVIFVYEGRRYRFDSEACRSGNGLIRLPSDEILRVGDWLESLPPHPHGLTPVIVTPEQAVQATPAVEEEMA